MRFKIDEPKTGKEIYQVGNVIKSDGDLFIVCRQGLNEPLFCLASLTTGQIVGTEHSLGELQDNNFGRLDKLITDVRLFKGDE